MNEVEYCARGGAYKTVECVLRTEDITCVVASAIEFDKWLYFHICRGMRTVNIRVVTATPLIKAGRVLAAVLREMENYKALNVEVTDTLFY